MYICDSKVFKPLDWYSNTNANRQRTQVQLAASCHLVYPYLGLRAAGHCPHKKNSGGGGWEKEGCNIKSNHLMSLFPVEFAKYYTTEKQINILGNWQEQNPWQLELLASGPPPCLRPSAALGRFAHHSAHRLNPELAEENNMQNQSSMVHLLGWFPRFYDWKYSQC